MSAPPDHDLTRLLHEWSRGDAGALRELFERVYPELHRIAVRHLSHERGGHTLQPTAIVHEAYIRFAKQRPGKAWTDRTHFYAVAARVLRAVLVDHARSRAALKRGAGAVEPGDAEIQVITEATPVDVLDLDAALTELEALNAEHSRIVELRHFAGLSIEETAEALAVSPATVKRGWLAAKTFIRHRLRGGSGLP